MARTRLSDLFGSIRERVLLPKTIVKNEWHQKFVENITAGPAPSRIQKFMLKEDLVVETKKIVVHRFLMGDVEDPDLMAGEPLWNWQQSEQGQWVMANSIETPVWHRNIDHTTYGHTYSITAIFETKKLTEYYLRFGKSPA